MLGEGLFKEREDGDEGEGEGEVFVAGKKLNWPTLREIPADEALTIRRA